MHAQVHGIWKRVSKKQMDELLIYLGLLYPEATFLSHEAIPCERWLQDVLYVKVTIPVFHLSIQMYIFQSLLDFMLFF